ncbi:TPA: helix-turn-helix transcriptional regulator [Salmonella enterica subsp. salamae serovar 53:z4,z24:-]|nr:AraC family transcriptional regulator [Salmonella enterica subsp. enterica]EDU0614753.1 AraC family transcriptional regulator [Salmonella enterica subsp. salamae]HCM1992739.1 helix-turn-helix transcriptional regulator [Salmonella enterica subsp. salamae serovar 53:z4,z24:-]
MPEITESIFVNSDLLNQHFDPDAIDTPIVSIYASYSHEKEHSLRSRMHTHAKGQLVYIKSGAAIVMLEARICSVLPQQLLWIPSGVSHNVILRDNVDFRAVYLDQKRFASLSKNVEVFTITPLMGEVIEAMCHSPFHTNWMMGAEFHLQSLLIDKIQATVPSPSWPALPHDSRVRNYLKCYRLKGEMVPRLNELASHCGASERTIHRLFVQGTGMCYQQWRQQVRLRLALELLITDKSITEIAHYLEFSTTSAFISFFKHHRGITPKKYRDQLYKSDVR